MLKTKLFKLAVLGSSVALAASFASPALAGDQGDHPEMRKDGPKGATLQINHQGKVVLNHAEIVSVSAPTLVVKLWGTNWSVTTTAETKMVRHFGGASALAEYMPGDFVDVRGTVVDGQLAINATHLKNQSTRAAAFKGVIATVTAPDMLTVRVGDKDRSVKVAADAKIMVGDAVKTFADLSLGMKVMVKGYMNRLSDVFTAYQVSARPLVPEPRPAE